jgi:Heterokaryon incompatibility protein (HET)
MVESYIYSPIAARSFRILKIFSGSSYQSILRCELIEASLDNRPGYEAISYTWGGQTPSQIIICEGRQLLVTRNCETALRHFRPGTKGEHRLLWIDSVCINQSTDSESMKERQAQLCLMGRIYSEADQVLVWLGDGSDPSQHSFARSTFNVTSVFGWLLRIAAAVVESMDERRNHDLLQILDEVDVTRRSIDLLLTINPGERYCYSFLRLRYWKDV